MPKWNQKSRGSKLNLMLLKHILIKWTILMGQDMLLNFIWILWEHLIMAILNTINQDFNSQDSEVNLKDTPNHTVNKDIIYNNLKIWINPRCKDNFMDSLKCNPAIVNLWLSQVMGNNQCNQDMDSHKCSKTMANHQCKWDMASSKCQVMDNRWCNQVLDSLKCIHKGILKLNLIQDNNLDNIPILHNRVHHNASHHNAKMNGIKSSPKKNGIKTIIQ